MESKLEASLRKVETNLKKFRLGENIETYIGDFQDFFQPPYLTIECNNPNDHYDAIVSFINKELIGFGINCQVKMCYCQIIQYGKKYKFSIEYPKESKLQEKEDLTFKILQKIPRIIDNYFIKNK